MSQLIRGAALIVIAGLAAGCSASTQKDSTPDPVARTMEGIANARMVGTDLLFGGQPTPEALAELAGEGFRTVITTRGDGEIKWNEAAVVDSLGMRFISIPMANPIEDIPDAWVDELDTALREAGRPMLLHCGSGNRVAGLWAVWLAERGHVAPSRALSLGEKAGMTRIRPVVEKRLGVEAR